MERWDLNQKGWLHSQALSGPLTTQSSVRYITTAFNILKGWQVTRGALMLNPHTPSSPTKKQASKAHTPIPLSSQVRRAQESDSEPQEFMPSARAHPTFLLHQVLVVF